MRKLLLAAAALFALAAPAAADQYGRNVIVETNPTVSTSAYSANNAVGGLQTVAAFVNTAQPSALITYVEVASKGGMTTGIEIWGFTAKPASTCTDSQAFALNNADLPNLIPGFPILLTPAAVNGTTQTLASVSSQIITSVRSQDAPPSRNLYFCAVTTGTPTLGSTTDLEFLYGFAQD